MQFRRFGLVALLALGSTFAVACGDDDDGGGGGGGGDSAFCDQAGELDESAGDEITDEEAVDEAIDEAQEVLDDAPSEIRGDVEVLIDVLEAVREGDFEYFVENQEEIEAAGRNIDEFCGLDRETEDIEIPDEVT